MNLFKRDAGGYLLAGLGNPGKKYEYSRHNTGFSAVDFFCGRHAIKVNRARFNALTGSGRIAGQNVVVIKPTTFMNLSGQAVAAAAKYHRIPLEHIIVVFDDVSLEPGHIRIRADGSAGGHNGVQNIIDMLGSEEFPRVKIGVGKKPRPDYDLADWVLSMPSSADRKLIEARFGDVADALELIIKGELPLAQSRYNG